MSNNVVFGFLFNAPTLDLPSSGYFFLRRCSAAFRFLAKWYNFNDPSLDLKFPWEQNAIQALLRSNPWIHQSLFIIHERQYRVAEEDQVISTAPRQSTRRSSSQRARLAQSAT